MHYTETTQPQFEQIEMEEDFSNDLPKEVQLTDFGTRQKLNGLLDNGKIIL